MHKEKPRSISLRLILCELLAASYSLLTAKIERCRVAAESDVEYLRIFGVLRSAQDDSAF